jgi:hypothetical protein
MTAHWLEAECVGVCALGFCISEAKEGMVTAEEEGGRTSQLNREVQNEEDERFGERALTAAADR